MFAVRKNSPHLVEEGKTIELKNPSKWTLTGYSRAGERTSFILNELKILFDAGLATNKIFNAIFLTHTHVDHCWNLPNIYGRKKDKDVKLTPVFFPKDSGENLTSLMRIACLLSYPKKIFSDEMVWKINGLEPFPVEIGNILSFPTYQVEVLRAVHTTTSQGYGFISKKSKLCKEFIGLSKNELTDLKKTGTSITEEVMIPEFAFYCDSTIHNLLNYKEWIKYPTIVVECTGFPESHKKEQVKSRGHTHFDDLLPVMLKHKNKHWVLIHASLKCNDEIFSQKIKELKNIGLDVTIVW
jgi:ribonuclease Z